MFKFNCAWKALLTIFFHLLRLRAESTRGRAGVDEERVAHKRGLNSGCAELGRETAKAVVA